MILLSNSCFTLLFLLSSTLTDKPTLPSHEFHLGKCFIEYNEKEQALQISMHLFIDDLEEALRQQGADKLFICTEKEDPKAETYIYKYLQQKFTLQLEDQPIQYTFLGKEISEDLAAVWCYLEVEHLETIQKLYVKNNALMDAFEDQQNIIKIVGPNKKKSYFLFDNKSYEETIQF